MQESDIRTKHLQQWVESVRKASNGAIDITIYPASTLVKTADVPASLSRNLVQLVGTFNTSAYAGTIPVAAILNPFTPKDYRKLVQDPDVLRILNKEAAQKINSYYLCTQGMGGYEFSLNKPFTSPEDLKGKLIRSPGGIRDEFIKAWGGKPVPLAAGEIYVAGQRGVVEGAAYSIQSFVAEKLYEVFPYVLRARLWEGAYNPLAVNLDAWKSLTPDLQKVLTDTALEMNTRSFDETVAQDTKDLDDLSKKGLIKIGNIDPKLRDEWLSRATPYFEPLFKAGGPVGEEMIEYLKKNHWK
jgi:TRAP-type C4-dicarboxylate transport system substrate-binding protein